MLKPFHLSAFLLTVATPLAAQEVLPSWTDSPRKAAIISFVETVTDEDSEDFVRAPERIAVFDNDGTLWSEQPYYIQLAFALDQIKAKAGDHPEWQEQEPFSSVLNDDLEGIAAGGSEALMKLIAETHGDYVPEDFRAEVGQWLHQTNHPDYGQPYADLTFVPMVELLDYLRENDFKTFIVSGGGVEFIRAISEELYGIPPEQVVGSELKLVLEERDGVPAVIRQGEVTFINDHGGKPIGIASHIGRKPIAVFGNSDGDFEMLEWALDGTRPGLGMIVHHDDGERAVAYDRDSLAGRLDRGLDEADAQGWHLISMKDDWRQIFSFQEPTDPAEEPQTAQ
ncbi:HAD family hydrolase [Paracoccus aerodenitrificans]|uniref:HAD family hydrolase n=1 Tax=Paracoccus aerodenitrificans TaxID=3017781 RepID=UPI0022F0F2C5|nr:HAD family hydrolase [Paracoccus aerodenitrificans]WBU63784.1 HAD family hydrolase [Paracoccus aerodenitrificans]